MDGADAQSVGQTEAQMLDLSHPRTQHIFQASRLLDSVMARGQKMSVSPSVVRAVLLAECLPLFAEMRELGRDQFGKQAAFILGAVDEYEAALRALASMGSGEIADDRWNGDDDCPACGTRITKHRFDADWLPACEKCEKPFVEELAARGWEQITEGQQDSDSGRCLCGDPLARFGPTRNGKRIEERWIIVCGQCVEPFMKAYGKLSSSEAFSTWAI